MSDRLLVVEYWACAFALDTQRRFLANVPHVRAVYDRSPLFT